MGGSFAGHPAPTVLDGLVGCALLGFGKKSVPQFWGQPATDEDMMKSAMYHWWIA